MYGVTKIRIIFFFTLRTGPVEALGYLRRVVFLKKLIILMVFPHDVCMLMGVELSVVLGGTRQGSSRPD